MILTESEAAGKWCRHVRHGFVTPGLAGTVKWVCAIVGINRSSKGDIPSSCLGSGCMAWRWADAETPADGGKRRGFCGDAGEPKHA